MKIYQKVKIKTKSYYGIGCLISNVKKSKYLVLPDYLKTIQDNLSIRITGSIFIHKKYLKQINNEKL